MGTPYEIDIALSKATVDALKQEAFALYAFKAVKTANPGAVPLVWFRTTMLLTSVKVTWEEQYQAFITAQDIVANVTIDASTNCDLDLGQTALVTPTGNIKPTAEGTDSAITILNQGTTPWTCGISQVAGGKANPLCAIPLHGQMEDQIAPIEKVLLMFASNTVNTGTVIYKAYSSGLMVDLTSSQTRSVSFDIDKGWDAGGGTWATSVAPNAALLPLLVTQ